MVEATRVILNSISENAPQQACEEVEKNRFTVKLVRRTTEGEELIIRTDLNE